MEVHLTKKDFKIDWFSGTGKGGQHRNKHQNCCRITHIDTGLTAQGTEGRDRITNQRTAFRRLAKRVLAHYYEETERLYNQEVIRNYNESRNEVHDKASGLKRLYTEIIGKGDLSEMIDARRHSKSGE
jgi:protein subunit release factor A